MSTHETNCCYNPEPHAEDGQCNNCGKFPKATGTPCCFVGNIGHDGPCKNISFQKGTVATEDGTVEKTADTILGISREQRRVFDAVAEFADACHELVLAEQGSCGPSDTMRQMIYSAALHTYGSSWVTDWVRNAMAGAALGVYEAYDQDLQRSADQVRHEQHQVDGVKQDDDCEVCVHIEELASV